jgi:hypothetical protein
VYAYLGLSSDHLHFGADANRKLLPTCINRSALRSIVRFDCWPRIFTGFSCMSTVSVLRLSILRRRCSRGSRGAHDALSLASLNVHTYFDNIEENPASASEGQQRRVSHDGVSCWTMLDGANRGRRQVVEWQLASAGTTLPDNDILDRRI